MKLVVGLGNPGLRYAHTRHNIGSMVVKALAKEHSAAFKLDKGVSAVSAKSVINRHAVLLAIPQVFMNLSGQAVAYICRKYAIDLEDLLIVCDDLDLEFGRLRVRPHGSSGGHHGLESIMASMGSNDFARLRIGIGRPAHPRQEAADYVLASFTRREAPLLKEVILSAAQCCEAWTTQGTTAAMNEFNNRR